VLDSLKESCAPSQGATAPQSTPSPPAHKLLRAIGQSSLRVISKRSRDAYRQALKAKSPLWSAITLTERVAALLLSVLSLPLLAASAAAVTVLSRQAPFVAHRRVGLHGSVLWVWKLRTMWAPSSRPPVKRGLVEFLPDAHVPHKKAVRDPRITSRFALVLRRYSIDELPQLWQVVIGQIALVGPRPLTEQEIALHYGPMAPTLLSVKPGLTRLWQVNGRNRLSYEQRRRFDQFMLDNWSPRLYFAILRATVYCVFSGKDAH
jgi:lipopolysaccharide/colanic/teichoic acid biosynthesis glycosyltransferase